MFFAYKIIWHNFCFISLGGVIMLNIEKTLLLARTVCKLGYINEAKTLYTNLLSIQPNHILAKKELKKLTK